MQTDAQTMLKDLGLLLGVPLALGVALLAWFRPWVPYEVPADSDIYAVVTGTWDWIGADSICVRAPTPYRSRLIVR